MKKLTKEQIEDHTINDTPLTLSIREVERLWNKALESHNEMELLQYTEVDLLLDAMLNKCYAVGVDKTSDQIEDVEKIKRYISDKMYTRTLNEFQARIIKDLELRNQKYELEVRKLKKLIEGLKY